MSNTTANSKTICPFYRTEHPLNLVCEGFTRTSESMIMFQERSDRALWQSAYCFTNKYKNCPLAETLLKKYDEK